MESRLSDFPSSLESALQFHLLFTSCTSPSPIPLLELHKDGEENNSSPYRSIAHPINPIKRCCLH